MIPLFVTAALVGSMVTAIHFCGNKALVLIPGTLGLLLTGAIGDSLLWEAAHGAYENSDTIIFGLPRIPNSAATWYSPVHITFVTVLIVVWLLIATFALWPKTRKTQRFDQR